MKKLMFAAAVMAAGAAMAVESGIVGYQKATPEYDYALIGVPFTSCAGEEIAIGEMKGTFVDGDQIQVPYIDEKGVLNNHIYEWYDIDPLLEEPNPGWYYDGEKADESLAFKNGESFWLITGDGQPTPDGATFAGAVSGEAKEYAEGFEEGWIVLSSAFPCAFNPNGDRVHWANLTDGDQIQVPYIDDAGYLNNHIYEWYYVDPLLEEPNPGWYYDGEKIDYDVCNVGEGFWVITQSPETVYLKEDCPIAK